MGLTSPFKPFVGLLLLFWTIQVGGSPIYCNCGGLKRNLRQDDEQDNNNDSKNAIGQDDAISPQHAAPSHRRHLETFPENLCGADNQYNIDLVVLSHLYFLMKPTAQAEANGCPHFLISSSSNQDENNKHVKIFQQLDSGSLVGLEAKLGFANQEAYILPFFDAEPLEKIAKAYNCASPDGKDQEGQPYDYIMNNCGDFLTNVLSQLGYTTTPNDAAMIAMVLHEAMDDDFYTQVRQAAANNPHASGVSSMTDAEVMHWLVHLRLQQIYKNPT